MNAVSTITTLAVFAFLCVVFLVAPTLHRGIVFGHTVDLDFTTSPGGRSILHRYRLIQLSLLAVFTAAFLVAQLLFTGIAPQWSMLALLILYVAAASTVWAWAFSRTRPHAIRVPLVRTADLVIDRRIEIVHLAALLPLVVAALVLAFAWTRIPGTFPMHWGAAGAANHWVHRTFATIFSPLLIAGLVIAALWATLRYATPGNPRMRWIFPAIAWYIAVIGTVTALLPLRLHPEALPIALLYAAPIVVVILSAIILLVHLRRPHLAVSEGDGTPDDRWIGGIFYCNAKDPALWVEKRMGIGWTLNFGHPASWLLLAGILAVPAVLAVAKLLARR